MGCTTEQSWLDSRKGKEIFSFPKRPDRMWGPTSLLLIGYRGVFLGGVSWPLTQSGAEIEDGWGYTSGSVYHENQTTGKRSAATFRNVVCNIYRLTSENWQCSAYCDVMNLVYSRQTRQQFSECEISINSS